ncbi:MAG: homoserine kinase [Bacillota bacterium]
MFELIVPATSANLGCGFDSLGVALNLYNRFVFQKNNIKNIEIEIINSDEKMNIPLEKNLVYIALKKLFNKVGCNLSGIKVVEYSNIPLARGLGSSATAIIGGLIGGNYYLGNPLSHKEIIELALEIEDHPDNIVPALVGGMVINILDKKDINYKKIKLENDLKIILVIPDFELETSKLRKVLPDKVRLKDAVFNHSRTALLTSVFIDKDWNKLGLAMQDKLHQQYRAKLIPGFNEVINKGYQSGALGIALSGAGPTIIVFSKNNCDLIGNEMVNTFKNYDITSKYILTDFNNSGAQIKK